MASSDELFDLMKTDDEDEFGMNGGSSIETHSGGGGGSTGAGPPAVCGRFEGLARPEPAEMMGVASFPMQLAAGDIRQFEIAVARHPRVAVEFEAGDGPPPPKRPKNPTKRVLGRMDTPQFAGTTVSALGCMYGGGGHVGAASERVRDLAVKAGFHMSTADKQRFLVQFGADVRLPPASKPKEEERAADFVHPFKHRLGGDGFGFFEGAGCYCASKVEVCPEHGAVPDAAAAATTLMKNPGNNEQGMFILYAVDPETGAPGFHVGVVATLKTKDFGEGTAIITAPGGKLFHDAALGPQPLDGWAVRVFKGDGRLDNTFAVAHIAHCMDGNSSPAAQLYNALHHPAMVASVRELWRKNLERFAYDSRVVGGGRHTFAAYLALCRMTGCPSYVVAKGRHYDESAAFWAVVMNAGEHEYLKAVLAACSAQVLRTIGNALCAHSGLQQPTLDMCTSSIAAVPAFAVAVCPDLAGLMKTAPAIAGPAAGAGGLAMVGPATRAAGKSVV